MGAIQKLEGWQVALADKLVRSVFTPVIADLIAERERAGDFEGAVCAAGRNAGPWLLFQWWVEGRLTIDQKRQLLPAVWSGAERPLSTLGARDWIGLFREVGYVTDDPSYSKLTEPLTVYRGATWGRRRGMSWTLCRLTAERFAARSLVLGPAYIFTATVPPTGVLAMIREERPGEDEVVVDPAYLPALGRNAGEAPRPFRELPPPAAGEP
jgi:hypothetical protein